MGYRIRGGGGEINHGPSDGGMNEIRQPLIG